ncbi:MAG: carbamoyltransferase HypF [Chitinivibrionales bacterium]|nr:carbamoyltransferase HypF [Chitinivibrionales bacterium]MBD3358492.1 carbamoyltransferase HypF [Chitinivibrionales bacterium]
MVEIRALKIRITGTVQGVGFRPFVYRTAVALGIGGEVLNDGKGVLIHAYGASTALNSFLEALTEQAPHLSRIREIRTEPLATSYAATKFLIADSKSGSGRETDIAHDTATCGACLNELHDPANRRHLHPFINCTDCGPRYSLITGLPYDRSNTTMASFSMCERCREEFLNPLDRRFHNQTVCCPDCGPRLRIEKGDGMQIDSNDPIEECRRFISEGGIAAIKGIGGYHLACRADHTPSVATLRSRKRRPSKPFALMVKDMDSARRIAVLTPNDEALLRGPEHPIVVVPKRKSRLVSREIAPGVDTLGIMLPYTPIHHLLFDRDVFRVLVMTSGNMSGEPMVHTEENARSSLVGIADLFLTHNRPIHVRVDDSIVRFAAGGPLLLRRARGFVQQSLPSPFSVEGIIALGGILKSTVAVGGKRNCYLSHYVGSLHNVNTLRALEEIAGHLIDLLDIRPSVYALDLHPCGLQRSLAAETKVPVEFIQHHHAHAAACMAENQVKGPAVCVVYDGTGYGEDGTLWGGEILIADYHGYRRAAHWSPIPLPGGEQAIRQPWRIALGALHSRMGDCALESAAPGVSKADREAVVEILRSGVSCPISSGIGRLFDAMSAALGICRVRTYEGQPAVELEAVADKTVTEIYDDMPIHKKDTTVVLDGPALAAAALLDMRRGTAVSRVVSRFHNTIAHATIQTVQKVAERERLDTVCLSGGCFQNVLLLERTITGLENTGLKVLIHRCIPSNDESTAYGQAVIAGARRYWKRCGTRGPNITSLART